MTLKAIDYAISNTDANWLKGVVLLPSELRALAFCGYSKERGQAALINLFVQFIGLANSVVANNREMIELLGITEGGDHPYTVEKYNLPTIFGAVCGVELANSIEPKKLCRGCAYRLGTCANQSPSTTCDADYTFAEHAADFMCHKRLDDQGNPTTLCVGHALRKKQQGKAA